MSQNLPNMLSDTISKIRDMMSVNDVVGEPIVVGDVTIVPISKVSVGFGGGMGGGVKVQPICFLVVKDGNVRMMPVPVPANSTADRILAITVVYGVRAIVEFLKIKNKRKGGASK